MFTMLLRPRRGISLIYVAIGGVAFFCMASLAVDYGRVQLAKTELRRAADAASRAGAAGLGNWQTARDLAAQYALANNVDGTPLVLDTSGGIGINDILFGTWDEVSKTFTTLAGSKRN